MLRAGPLVSLVGSPTVSPITPASCASDPFPPWFPSSIYFFALSAAPPKLFKNKANKNPEIIDAMENKFKNKGKVFLKLGKMLESNNKKNKTISSILWEKYERTLSVLNPGEINLKYIKKTKTTKRLPNSPFLEWHYTKNNFFLKKNEILKNIKKIDRIPTIIIQGRYDLICPPKSAFIIAKKMKNCEIKFIENSGHSASEPKIKSNILSAIEKIFYKIKK